MSMMLEESCVVFLKWCFILIVSYISIKLCCNIYLLEFHYLFPQVCRIFLLFDLYMESLLQVFSICTFPQSSATLLQYRAVCLWCYLLFFLVRNVLAFIEPNNKYKLYTRPIKLLIRLDSPFWSLITKGNPNPAKETNR